MSAFGSPAPQCHWVEEFMMATSTSFSSCFASCEPACALSMRSPAVRRARNCVTDSPGRRVSMPDTAFCRHSSWSIAEPASKPSSSSSSPSPLFSSESESESESGASSIDKLGPESCLSSVTRKEKSRAFAFPSSVVEGAGSISFASGGAPVAVAEIGACATPAAGKVPTAAPPSIPIPGHTTPLTPLATRSSAAFTASLSYAGSPPPRGRRRSYDALRLRRLSLPRGE
mmetsp:Transcript_28708/g.71518  ORF Transcript_28708/g.71518 Transcript_28708/m.71518 type:complete len:229 (-) Transcript_28708:158-844(-)